MHGIVDGQAFAAALPLRLPADSGVAIEDGVAIKRTMMQVNGAA